MFNHDLPLFRQQADMLDTDASGWQCNTSSPAQQAGHVHTQFCRDNSRFMMSKHNADSHMNMGCGGQWPPKTITDIIVGVLGMSGSCAHEAWCQVQMQAVIQDTFKKWLSRPE